ncbi:helix-turn-helix transcriptional regulator [Geobacter sp. DSM 9736]|uniref:ArsR/SmtB family transcription factor n=1 Tax=Geobacter sp. DSM 9736 TaxID=1277350 RepID=UPI000B505BA2|nr:metalloregulator ArsR/SmtB family transcription factor [Geobacter sp. DSM 9736]
MEKKLKEMSLVFKTLGHPVRLRIAAGLANNKCACVKEIWECLGMPQAIVSQHLKVMKQNGVLVARREGAKVCYSLRTDLITQMVKMLEINPHP